MQRERERERERERKREKERERETCHFEMSVGKCEERAVDCDV